MMEDKMQIKVSAQSLMNSKEKRLNKYQLVMYTLAQQLKRASSCAGEPKAMFLMLDKLQCLNPSKRTQLQLQLEVFTLVLQTQKANQTAGEAMSLVRAVNRSIFLAHVSWITLVKLLNHLFTMTFSLTFHSVLTSAMVMNSCRREFARKTVKLEQHMSKAC